MSDKNEVHIGENSTEHVAYKLMQHIAAVEGKEFYTINGKQADRQWILSTYKECLKITRNPFFGD